MKQFLLVCLSFSSVFGMQGEKDSLVPQKQQPDFRESLQAHRTAFAEQFVRLEVTNSDAIKKSNEELLSRLEKTIAENKKEHEQKLAEQFVQLKVANSETIKKNNEKLSSLEKIIADSKKEHEQKLKEQQDQTTNAHLLTGIALVGAAALTVGMIYVCTKYRPLSISEVNSKLDKLTDRVDQHDTAIRSNAGNINNLGQTVSTVRQGCIDNANRARLIEEKLNASKEPAKPAPAKEPVRPAAIKEPAQPAAADESHSSIADVGNESPRHRKHKKGIMFWQYTQLNDKNIRCIIL